MWKNDFDGVADYHVAGTHSPKGDKVSRDFVNGDFFFSNHIA
jgi:hypothetical protein